MKRIALGNEFLRTTLTAALVFSAATAAAVDFAIDPSNSNNGLFDIYSATFDPPLNPGGDPFFGGTPPATREITIIPTPTGVLAASPATLAHGCARSWTQSRFPAWRCSSGRSKSIG